MDCSISGFFFIFRRPDNEVGTVYGNKMVSPAEAVNKPGVEIPFTAVPFP
jgi:hypothetical protein